MKLPLQDRQIKTSCKECVCAIYEDATQTGCSFNRIDKFGTDVIEAYDDNKEFYVIKRFCNFYRNPTWNNGEFDAEKIKHECACSFEVIINCDDLNTDMDREDLIDIIKNTHYYNDKVKISLIHSNKVDMNVRRNIFNVFCSVTCSMSEVLDLNDYLHNKFVSSNSTYHIVVDVSNKSIIRSLYKINDSINNDLNKGIIFNFGSYGMAISNVAYRIESLSNDIKIYNDNVTSLVNKSLESNLYIGIS